MENENAAPQEPQGLCLMDSRGKVRVNLQVDEKSGNPYFHFNDAEGRPRLSMALGPDGRPNITFFSKDSVSILAIGVSAEDNGCGLTLWTPNGKHQLNFGVNGDGLVFQAS
jgi:hypothetical protein